MEVEKDQQLPGAGAPGEFGGPRGGCACGRLAQGHRDDGTAQCLGGGGYKSDVCTLNLHKTWQVLSKYSLQIVPMATLVLKLCCIRLYLWGKLDEGYQKLYCICIFL